jgi:hypothetical protein
MTNMNCFACFAEVMDLYHHHKDYKGQIYGGMHAGVRGLGGLVSDLSGGLVLFVVVCMISFACRHRT